MFYASVDATAVYRLDLENQLLLGGDSGLRGYPLRYQSGEERALVTLEQRYYTNWYPLRLARVGAAVFFDGGRVWDRDAFNSQNLGWLRDVGFGLRLSLTRSGLGSVGHIDFAFPLDGDPSIDPFQLLVGVQSTF
ncbi:MAG: hypothetical protein FD165_646 [Gammaproteobacteria bacterium]|nr:MAG: hypothetical protein FD165_646 [Gammaproteobacteria bacterium]TND02090.1 MAG: hypothetical protein FD120_2254 [Gammaproteobacteria bacterium]